MKNRLLVILILLCTRSVFSQGHSNRPVIGPYVYDSKKNSLFTHATDKDGLYKVMNDNPAAYTDRGKKIKYKKGEYIYVSGPGDFYVGTYQGKSGKWAEINGDTDAKAQGTFIYVFFADLKHEKLEYHYALGLSSKTNPFTLVEREESTYEIKNHKNIFDDQGRNYYGLHSGNTIKVYRKNFFQGSFKGISGVWVSTNVGRLKSVYIPIDDLEKIDLTDHSDDNSIYGAHIGWIALGAMAMLLIIILVYNSTQTKSYTSSGGGGYIGTGQAPFNLNSQSGHKSFGSSDYSPTYTSSSNKNNSHSKPKEQSYQPVESPLSDIFRDMDKNRRREELDRDIEYQEKLGRSAEDLKVERDRL